MTEKYSLLPLNPQQLTPVQTAIQRMSEKHPDFEIEPVNTIRTPEIEYTPGCQLDFVKKKVFLKGLIFKKKGFCNKKKGFPCQMDSFLIPAKGFFTSCILK